MAKKANQKIEPGAVDIEQKIESIKALSTDKKYEYLEQLRDYIYKDVVLADTKAGFALTIVTVALGAALTLNIDTNFFWYIGLFFAIIAILCSMLTILPRSYVTHDMIKKSNHWVHLGGNWKNAIKRRYYDAANVLFENFWQKPSQGTTDSLRLLMKSSSSEELVASLSEGMQRAFLAMNLKYLWVGKSLLFGFIAFCFMGLSLLHSTNEKKKTNNSGIKESAIIKKDSLVLLKDSLQLRIQRDTLMNKSLNMQAIKRNER